MKNKLALIIAIILGVIAVLGVHKYIQGKQDETRTKYKPARIAVAGERIKSGTVIEMKMLDKDGKEVTEDSLTQAHILHNDRFMFAGQTINRDIERGEPLFKSYFLQPVVRLEKTINLGERAVTLKVDNITGVAGNVAPGSHVDIWGTFNLASAGASGQSSKEGITAALLSNVTVLAVDNRTRAGQYSLARGMRDAYGSVTIAVTPEEAGMLIYAQSIGMLTLALRCPSDSDTPSAPEAFSEQNLLTRSQAAEGERRKRNEKKLPLLVVPRR